MQTKCLRLMGKKLLVALTLEGKFASEGLHDLEEDDDMLAALARELVEKDGVGQTADAIWSELKQIYDQLPTAAPSLPPLEDDNVIPELPVVEPLADFVAFDHTPLSNPTQSDLLMTAVLQAETPTAFGQTFSGGKRKTRRRPTVPEQASLFSWN